MRFLRIQQTTVGDVQQVNLRCVNTRCHQLCSPLSLFWNLQTLIILNRYESDFILYEFWEMVQLRDLEMKPRPGIHVPDPLPSDQVMQNLKTLQGVVNLKLSEEFCERIPNIKELRLHYYDYYDSEEEEGYLRSSSYYSLHNLGRFYNLISLELSIERELCESSFLSLELPSSLKKLHLYGCNLYNWEEITRMAGSLPHLEHLNLDNILFIGSEWSLVEEKFPRLKSLTIKNCNDLVYWEADNSSFPVLEYLVIDGVKKLDEIPWGMGETPTLQSIYLSRCSDELLVSAARMVMESQEEHGNEDLKLELDFYARRRDQVENLKRKLEAEGLTIGKNWWAAQMPGQVFSGEAMEGGDWRTQLPQGSRQRIVNKIMMTLQWHLPFSGQKELKKKAVRFEEKSFTAATSQSDYLRKISLEMLPMETKS